jgi:uroporphyrinogen-III synthase
LRVAITRTPPQAEDTAARVREYGAEPVLAPLLTLSPRAFDTDITGAQALLFTSANGVAAYGGASGARGITVFTVGDATAHAARKAGFAAVRSAAGDVAALATLVTRTLDPNAGPLLHVGGAHLAGDLERALQAAGFSYERRVGYETVAVTRLPAAFDAPLDLVLFHSPRAAETFIALGAPQAAAMTAGCISEAVAQAVRQAPWSRVIVAPAPREDALLAACLGGQDSPAGASA